MNYRAYVSVSSSTNGVLPHQDRTATCAPQEEERSVFFLNGTNQQDTCRNPPQYSAPAAAFYEALLATAAANASQEVSGFEKLGAPAAQTSLYAAAALSGVSVTAADNYLFTQRQRSGALVCPSRTEAGDWQPATAFPAEATGNTASPNASSAGYTVAGRAPRAAPRPFEDKLIQPKEERCLSSGTAPATATAGGAAPISADEKENVAPTTLQCCSLLSRGNNVRQDVFEKATSCVRQNTTTAVNESRREHREKNVSLSQATESVRRMSFTGGPSCEARSPLAPTLDLHEWNQVPLVASDQQAVPDVPRSSWTSSRVRTPAVPQPEKQQASGGTMCPSRRSSAAIGGCLLSAQQGRCTSSNGNSPAKCSTLEENTSKLVLPRQGRARASLSTWCWDTGKYSYPDACTPRVWSGNTSAASLEVGCEPPTDEACYLRSFRCVSSPGFVRLPSPTFPDSTSCSKVAAGCGLASLCGFTVSPARSPGVNRGHRTISGTGGSTSDWLAVARGRDSTAPFCRITLEEAAGDGLCNPHHELQSLADVLREEEGPPAFMPTLLLTSEVRGLQVHGGLDFHWRDVAIPASDGRPSSASLPGAVYCSGPRDHPVSPTAFSESDVRLATPTRPPNPEKRLRRSQSRSSLVSESKQAFAGTLLLSKAVSPLLSDVSRNGLNPFPPCVVGGSGIPKMTVPLTELSPADDNVPLRRSSSAAAVALPSSSAIDAQCLSAREERTLPASLGTTDSSGSVSQEAVAQPCHQQVKLGSRSTTPGQSSSFAAETTCEKTASSSRASLPVGLDSGGSTESGIALEGSRMYTPITDLLRTAPPHPDTSRVCSAPRLDHPTRQSPHASHADIPVAPSTLPIKIHTEDLARTWHMASSGKTYALAPDSTVNCPCPTACHSVAESCWTQETEATASAKAVQADELVGVQDTGEEQAKEGHGSVSTDVSTAPSVCGSGSSAASPLTPPQGSPATAAATTTSTTPRRGTLAQCSSDVRPSSLEPSCFSLPPPSASCFRGQVDAENETIPSSRRTRNIFDRSSVEFDKSTTTSTTGTRNLLSPRKSISVCDNNSTSCTNTSVESSATITASMSSRKNEKYSPSQQVLLCPTAGPGGLPMAPTELETRPQMKNKLDRLKFSALPTANFADSPHSEHSALQFPQYGVAAARSCGSRTASESVPTPTTAGHSSQSPLAFSPLSSEGDATTGNGNAAVALGVSSTQQQDFFSAASTDGSRDTPSPINGCVVSTPATAIRLVEFFSEKEAETNVSESTARQAAAPLSFTDPADSTACHITEVQQCGIPALSAPAQAAIRTRVVVPTTRPLALSTADWIPNAPPAESCNDMLLAEDQESGDKVISGQTSSAVGDKSTAGLVAADNCTEKVYQVAVSPAVLQTPPASLTGSGPQAAHCVVPSVEGLEHISQENKLDTLKYVLAGSEGDVPQCTQYSGNLLQQQLAASLMSKDLAHTYQQWWLTNCESLQPRQQQNAGHDNQDNALPCGQSEYPEGDLTDPSACTGNSYAGTGVRKEVVTKYVEPCETVGAAAEKLHLAANVGTNAGYQPAEEELNEYEEQWDGAQCTAFDLGDAGPTAVPVRTRKGFRKPLPLPQEMLACSGEPGESEKGNEPVLQYDVSSREWRVFWVEDRLARYKVFQAKKFGKERAQQLAEEWYRRARSGDVSGGGRGLRGGVRGHINAKSKKLKVEL